MDISGTRYSDIITQEHVVSILSNQKALNFKPGEQYMYSNSGFTLLAEIVKSVTGQTLRQFADSAIFKPLGMTKSFFRDDNSEIIKNRAASYRRLDKTHFANSVFNNSSVGATNLSTTIDDMSKWVSNFYYTKAGNQNDINLLTQKGKLNNGKELNYAAGIVSGTYKGWREFAHAGGDAGYRTYITVFPDLKMGFLVFANVPEVGTSQKAHQLADLFISDTSGLKSLPQKIDSSKAFLKDASIIKKIAEII
jgi:CubicO group peptidase (beta-lactamase class C family)